MKKTNILMTLVLLFAASVSLQAQKYTVKQRVGLQDANVNGSVSATPQNPEAGTTVQVTCTPNGGFGLVRGVFYAVKDANGEYGETKMAKNTSEYKEDLANPQNFTFTMPHGNVEIWAYFDSTRVMVIHDAPEGKLEPVYGRREHKPKNEVYNVPRHPVKLKVVPNDNLYELVDVKFNINMAGHHKKTTDTVTVLMPSTKDTLHITPVFAKKNYQVTVDAQNVPHIKVKLSSEAPKAYEEVEAVLESEKNYIPIDVSITGCLSSWRVGKPQRKDDGGWKTVYRFKVGLQDVAIDFKQQQVSAFTVSETGKSGRVRTLIPEMSLVVAEGNEEIKTLEDLKGKKTSNSPNSTYAMRAEEEGAEVVYVDTLGETMAMLEDGRVDATLNATESVQSYLKEHPDAKIKIVLTVPGEAVAVPMKKGPETETLKAEIDRILEEARENGKLAELSIKYFGRDLTKAE